MNNPNQWLLNWWCNEEKRSSLLSRREEAARLEAELACIEERTAKLEQQIKDEENYIERAQRERQVCVG